MYANTIDVSDLREYKFYHLVAKCDNALNTINKELLICVDAHAIYYIVKSFGGVIKETADMKLAVETYNQIAEVQ
jgi:hypothetical protein